MKFILALLKILAAIYIFAFAGAVPGAFAGFIFAVLGVVDFQQMTWFMGVGGALFVVWGFTSSGGGSDELPEPRQKPKQTALSSPSDLWDDDCPRRMFNPDDPFRMGCL